METWAIGLSAISAFFAAIAALASLGQARKASQANEVNIYLAMLKEYRSAEMSDAVLTLATLFNKEDGKIAEWYRRESKVNPEHTEIIYQKARVIVVYFIHCGKLYENGFISNKVFRSISYHPGINIFYQVASPMILVRNSHSEAKIYAEFLKMYIGVYGDGVVY